jgi:hypothetical protein
VPQSALEWLWLALWSALEVLWSALEILRSALEVLWSVLRLVPGSAGMR